MPSYTIFDDGIIDMYNRNECDQKFYTMDELIDALITAGVIESGIIVSIPVLAFIFLEMYNRMNQYNNTANRTPEGYYTGKLPTFQSKAIYLDNRTDDFLNKSPLEIENIYEYRSEFEKNQYTFNNKWLFPKEVIFTYQMNRVKGDDGKDRNCCKMDSGYIDNPFI